MSSSPGSTRAAAQVTIRHRIGALRLDVDFSVTAPWTLLFGASGSGKSTILRAIAGLIRPDEGRIVVRDRVLLDTNSTVCVPAHLRDIRWGGQRAVLFPRMTVEENLAFAAASMAAQAVSFETDRALEAFHLTELAKRKTDGLSGGERQRVSVARAAISAPGKLLLLDEPFSGLDAEVRDALIEDVRNWIGETPVISVTHDVGEAFLLGAEIVRLAEGRIEGQGPVEAVLAEERRRLRTVLGREER